MKPIPREVNEKKELDEKPDVNELKRQNYTTAADLQCQAETNLVPNEPIPPCIRCELCNLAYFDCDYIGHMRNHHPEIARSMAPYRCPYCYKQSFCTNNELIYHYESCSEFVPSQDWTCSQITACFYTMGHKVYCPIPECGKLCPTFFYLSAHLLNHREKGCFFKCNACNFVYRNAYHLKAHLLREAKLHQKYQRCHNSATVIEKKEAEGDMKRLGPNIVYPVSSRKDRPPTAFFPQLTGCSGIIMQPKTLQDAELIEGRKSILDARLKVRHDSTELSTFLTTHISPVPHLPAILKRRAESINKEGVSSNNSKTGPIARKFLRNDPGCFGSEKSATEFREGPSCSTYDGSDEHALEKYEAAIKCPYCQVDQKGMELLALHSSRHHPSHSGHLIFSCSGCSCRFDQPQSLKAHLLAQFKHRRRYCTNTAVVLVRSPVGKPIRVEEYVRMFLPESSEIKEEVEDPGYDLKPEIGITANISATVPLNGVRQ